MSQKWVFGYEPSASKTHLQGVLVDKINRELHKLRRRITRVAWCLRKNVRSLVSYMPLASSCAAVKGKRLTRAVLSLVSEHSDTSITAPGSCPHRSAPLPSAATSSPPRVQQQKLTKADDERTHYQSRRSPERARDLSYHVPAALQNARGPRPVDGAHR